MAVSTAKSGQAFWTRGPDLPCRWAPQVPLASFASLHFLELLVGPKAAGLDIKNPKKIGELTPSCSSAVKTWSPNITLISTISVGRRPARPAPVPALALVG